MRARLMVLAAAVLFSTGGAAIKATSLSGNGGTQQGQRQRHDERRTGALDGS